MDGAPFGVREKHNFDPIFNSFQGTFDNMDLFYNFGSKLARRKVSWSLLLLLRIFRRALFLFFFRRRIRMRSRRSLLLLFGRL